jgi:hypothetical protein
MPLSGWLSFLSHASASLDRKFVQLSQLSALSDDEFECINNAAIELQNTLTAESADVLRVGSWPTDRMLSLPLPFRDLDHDTGVAVTLSTRNCFQAGIFLRFLESAPITRYQREALCQEYANVCHFEPTLLLLLSDEDREILLTRRQEPYPHDSYPTDDGLQYVTFAIAQAMSAHSHHMNRHLMSGLFNANIESLSLALEYIDDLIWFLGDTSIGDPPVDDFLSLDQPVNLNTLLHHATVYPSEYRIFPDCTVMAKPLHLPRVVVLNFPTADFASRISSRAALAAYAENPLAFVLQHKDELPAGNLLQTYRRLGQIILRMSHEIITGRTIQDAMASPLSHATVLGVLTFTLSGFVTQVNPAGAVVAALVDLALEYLFNRDRRIESPGRPNSG